MTIFYSHDKEFIIVSGKTFPHKEAIKALGGRFLGHTKEWQVTYNPDRLKQIEELCLGLGGGARHLPGPITVEAPLDSDISFEQENKETVDSKALSVKELYSLAAGAISTAFPYPIWVIGEIQNFQIKAQAIYFNLAEHDGRSSQGTVTVSVNIWPSLFKKIEKSLGNSIAGTLADGLEVRCLCQVSFYRGRGNISLNVIDIDANYLKGALALAREALLKELRAKGLDQANKRLLLVRTPLRIGLLTAEASRAQSDFLHQLEEAAYPGTVIFVPVAVQGETVPKSVCQGMDQLLSQDVDLIVLTRGGGSAADLRWFDDREIAFKIAMSPVPIIAAIGHHDDTCVAEEISFMRRKTPTAAADFIIECFLGVRRNIEQAAELFQARLQRGLLTATEAGTKALQMLQLSATLRLKVNEEALAKQELLLHQLSLDRLLRNDRQLGLIKQNLGLAWERGISRFELDHLRLAGMLNEWDPKPALAKGWTQLLGKKGQVRSVQAIAPGDLIRARVLDGEIIARVENVIENAKIEGSKDVRE